MMNEGANGSHDVFLSFRGEDTRSTFTGNLYNALRSKRIKTFFQDMLLEKGDPMSCSTFKAIKESTISIVVLSENYAHSRWCLDELVSILECKKMNNQLVWPIFYHVHPSEVRHQKNGYGEAMRRHEERFGEHSETVQRWRFALSEVTSLSGWMYKDESYEYELIDKIVELVVQSLPHLDIFLSFTGEDTRYSFTGFLYDAFRREGFKIFNDDEGLVSGNEISQALIKAIEKSRLSIVVLSENYAYSSWCLDELVKIIECMKTKNQLVWPIFYKVEQSDVSNQAKSYGEAMIAHENRFGKESEKVKKWRSALSEVANLKGQHLKEKEYEYEFIERIVEMAINIENS